MAAPRSWPRHEMRQGVALFFFVVAMASTVVGQDDPTLQLNSQQGMYEWNSKSPLRVTPRVGAAFAGMPATALRADGKTTRRSWRIL